MRTLRNPFIWLALAAVLGACILFTPGCKTLDAGADPFVVRVEQTQTVVEGGFDLLLNVDNLDRGFWRTNAPAFHQFCETLRFPVPVAGVPNRPTLPRYIAAQWELDQAKLYYKFAKSSSASNSLQVALITLQGLSEQTTAWLTIVTNKPTRN